jgi:precorrin-2/cobalt-factor-2 C20-methyltransferase
MSDLLTPASDCDHFGSLYGISAGPGDPNLITVCALRHLRQAEVVAFPAGVSRPQGIAETIVEPWLRSHQQRLRLEFPMVPNLDQWPAAWAAAADQVWKHLAQRQTVAFVSEGDVSFYSTYTYLEQTLKARCPALQTLAIPGVCSPLAAVAALGIPLTSQGDRLVILPALYQVEELRHILAWAEVVVLLKVGSVYPQVWEVLAECGLLTKTALAIRVTMEQQKLLRDLTAYRELKPPYFSLMVIKTHI